MLPGEFLRKPAQKQVMFRKVFKKPAVGLTVDPRGICPLAARLQVFFCFFLLPCVLLTHILESTIKSYCQESEEKSSSETEKQYEPHRRYSFIYSNDTLTPKTSFYNMPAEFENHNVLCPGAAREREEKP